MSVKRKFESETAEMMDQQALRRRKKQDLLDLLYEIFPEDEADEDQNLFARLQEGFGVDSRGTSPDLQSSENEDSEILYCTCSEADFDDDNDTQAGCHALHCPITAQIQQEEVQSETSEGLIVMNNFEWLPRDVCPTGECNSDGPCVPEPKTDEQKAQCALDAECSLVSGPNHTNLEVAEEEILNAIFEDLGPEFVDLLSFGSVPLMIEEWSIENDSDWMLMEDDWMH